MSPPSASSSGRPDEVLRPPEIRAGPTVLHWVPVLRSACIPAPAWRAWAATSQHPTRTAPTGSPASEQKMGGPLPDAALRCPSSMPANPRRPAGHPLQSMRSGGSMTPYPSHRPPMLQRPQQPASPISACAFSGPPHADMGTDQNVRRRLVETSKALSMQCNQSQRTQGGSCRRRLANAKKRCLSDLFISQRPGAISPLCPYLTLVERAGAFSIPAPQRHGTATERACHR